MQISQRKTLAVSVNHNRIALMFILGRQPVYWEMSYVAAFTPTRAAEKIAYWVKFYDANLVITEDLRGGSRKGKHTQAMLESIEGKLADLKVQHMQVPRYQPFQSKYEQMDNLCEKYPQLKVLAVQKRKYWENEHHYVSYFEAVAMADYVLDNRPPKNLPI